MRVIFDAVFFVEAWLRTGSFRPQIGNIVGSSQLQANDVIHLILASYVPCDPVFIVDFVLQALWDIAYRLRISWDANLLFCGVGEDGTGSTGRIRKSIMCHTS